MLAGRHAALKSAAASCVLDWSVLLMQAALVWQSVCPSFLVGRWHHLKPCASLLQVLALDSNLQKLAETLKDENSLLVFGRGYNYATALEAALKVCCRLLICLHRCCCLPAKGMELFIVYFIDPSFVSLTPAVG